MATRRPNKNGLNPQQQAFVDAYCADPQRNGTAAARTAGYTGNPATLNVTAVRLLHHTKVKALIEAKLEASAAKADLTTERLDQEISRLAFFDQRKLYHPDGRPKLPHEWDDDTAAALAGADIEYVTVGKGKARREVARIKKHRLWSKSDALLMAGRRLGAFKDKFDVTGTLKLEELVLGAYKVIDGTFKVIEKGKDDGADPAE